MSGPSLRWELPYHNEDALTLVDYSPVISRMVESVLDEADEGAFDSAEELVDICDTLRVPAEVVIGGPEPLVEQARDLDLPESVELVVGDGGEQEREPCPVCASPLVNDECVITSCPGPADESDDEGDDDLATDGGRTFTTQPETCDECGLTLDENGECPTAGCDGGE